MAYISSDYEKLDALASRVEFFESSVDELKKEIPRYLAKNIELKKSHKNLATVLRCVASSESNQKLQNLIFRYAQKQEELESGSLLFSLGETKCHQIIEQANGMLITPMKELILDHKALCNSKTKRDKRSAADESFVKSTLPVHTKMFEKHRVKCLKQLFSTLIDAELRYHCKALEDLSIVLQDLSHLEEEDISERDCNLPMK